MPAHIDLAGDGGGNQGGATLLQDVDGALGFGGEIVETYTLIGNEKQNFDLFFFWR